MARGLRGLLLYRIFSSLLAQKRESEELYEVLIKNRELKGFKVGGRKWRFEESDIEDYIKRQRQKAEQQQKDTSVA